MSDILVQFMVCSAVDDAHVPDKTLVRCFFPKWADIGVSPDVIASRQV